MSIAARRHGWKRPLHHLQIVGISVFCFLVAAFYCFVGLFLGHRIAEITVNTVFSFAALSSALLFIRCAGTDPSDRIRFRFRKKKQKGTSGVPKLNYGYIFSRIVLRFFRRMERKILTTCIRRKYLDPWNTRIQIEPLIPFPLVLEDDDSLTPDPKDEDVSFCSLCNFEVHRYSKHCRTCNRCVEGFDHHCRWLNNCVGKRNYTTFILLMVFVLIMLIVEGGTAIAVFVRCFSDSNSVQHELNRNYVKFPRALLAALSIILVLLTTYGTAALGQLFFFHVLLIRKGISTYEYILAMKEESLSMNLELSVEDSSDFSSSDEDDNEDDYTSDFDSPKKRAAFLSRIICKDGKMQQIQNPKKLAIRIDGECAEATSSILNKKKQSGFRASIDPWKLIKLSREKALLAADKAREKVAVIIHKESSGDPLKSLPLETRSGPLTKFDKDLMANKGLDLVPAITKGMVLLNSPRPLKNSSPRRRLSCSPILQQHSGTAAPSPKHNRYRSDFDLRLTQVSRELETHISKQVLCSVLKKEGFQGSPR